VVDPVLAAQLHRLHVELNRELVHDSLDAERSLRAAGATIGVGPGHVGEHVGAGEVVGGELVDGVEHERPQHRDTGGDQAEVGAHVGHQFHLEPGDRAVAVGGDGDVLDLVAAVVPGEQRLRAGLGVLHRLAQASPDQHGDDLLRGHLQLAAEATADVRCDHPDLVLGDAQRHGHHGAHDVRHLGGRPQRELLAGGVTHHRAGLHEGGNQPLLAEAALDGDFRGRDRVLYAAAGAGFRGVEHPEGALVGPQIRVHQIGTVGQGGLHVQHGGQLVVVDLDAVQRVGRLVGGTSGNHRDDLPREVDGVHRDGGVRGRLHVRGDRPGTRQTALLLGEVLPGVDRDDARALAHLADVERGDLRVREGAAEHGEVQHAGKHDVVGVAGAAGDQPGVFLAQPRLAELGGGRFYCGHVRHLHASWIVTVWSGPRLAPL